MSRTITEDAIKVARVAFPLAQCPYCDGDGFTHANEIQAHFTPMLLVSEDRLSCYACCFACGAKQSPQETPEKAAKRWNTRTRLPTTENLAREQVEKIAAGCGLNVPLTLPLTQFARFVQEHVLRVNRRT